MSRVVGVYLRHATAVWLVVLVCLGLLQAAAARNTMNPDGIAYLDMGDAYLRGDWSTALRTHWSPLYAWIQAAALHLTRPPPELEFPEVHLVNLGVYCLALAAFTFLLREIVASLDRLDVDQRGVPDWAWVSLGYALFGWCTLNYMPLDLVTPDLLVSTFVYAIGGVMLRARRQAQLRWALALGALLGVGYLAKAPMLALAPLFLGASTLVLRGARRRTWHLTNASLTLIVVAVPYMLMLSIANGRPTAGDSAALNYLWTIDGAPLVHWQGGPPALGQPLHHSQLLLDRPPVFAFDAPFAVTYAPWYAPEYWFVGATPFFRLGAQVRAIVAGLQVYSRIVVDLSVVLALLSVLLLMRHKPWSIRWTGPWLVLLAPAVAAFCMYDLVLVEARYVAPFVVLFMLALLMLVRLPKTAWSAALLSWTALLIVLVQMLQIGSILADPAGSLVSEIREGAQLVPDDNAQVALALRSAGIQPGAPVASGERGFNAYWARLARVRIVAEVSGFEGPAILETDQQARAATQRALLAQDVRALVARGWPALTGDPAWQRVGDTDYFYVLLPQRTSLALSAT
jgi:hypothetical protein